MKIACLADQHGNLPEIPDCDLLLIAGDISPLKLQNDIAIVNWMDGAFRIWLDELVERNIHIVAVAGNHDFCFAHSLCSNLIKELNLPWTYLQDNGENFKGFNIWGSPWQPIFHHWAFNATEEELSQRWDLIPANTDILLLHGPPYGVGDFSLYGKEHTGSPSLLRKIEQIKPRLVVYGHIHSSYGVYNIGNTIAVNAALVNEKYQLYNQPIRIDL